METKICSGKHGCGKELSIEMFVITINYVKGKAYKVCRNMCIPCKKAYDKECNKKYEKTDKCKKSRKKQRCSKKGRESSRRRTNAYRSRNLDKITKEVKEYNRQAREELKDGYVNRILIIKHGFNKDFISSEITNAKKAQLKLYRYANQENN